MHSFLNKIEIWLIAVRAYSLPISIMSWIVPFLYGFLQGGNIKFGIISLLGILTLHMATNIFDDAIDYTREKKEIEKGLKENFNFQKNKCACIFNKELTIKQYYIASVLLFGISTLIAIYFLNIYGFELLKIIIPSTILCILYPLLGCLGFGELIVAIVFSPLLYLGVLFSMTGSYSIDILIISISTGLLSVAVLHNHMLLDFKFDEQNRKTTLCRLCKTEKKALYLLGIIISLAYLNILVAVLTKHLSLHYLITLLSLPTAIMAYKTMLTHIKTPDKPIKINFFMGNTDAIKKVPTEQQGFLLKFIIVRNLLSVFTWLICIAIVLSNL